MSSYTTDYRKATASLKSEDRPRWIARADDALNHAAVAEALIAGATLIAAVRLH